MGPGLNAFEVESTTLVRNRIAAVLQVHSNIGYTLVFAESFLAAITFQYSADDRAG